MQYVRENFNTEIMVSSFFRRSDNLGSDDIEEMRGYGVSGWRSMNIDVIGDIEQLNPWNRIISRISWRQAKHANDRIERVQQRIERIEAAAAA